MKEFLEQYPGLLEQLALLGQIWLMFKIVFGALNCFMGYKLLRVWTALGGFALGAAGGFLAARRLRELDQKVPLIFLTDTSQYAVMGVRLHLTDYVVKPAEFKHLVRALKLAGIGNGR